ncbi:hypothetical protein BBJ29_004261 [Phytophthora kernoviae]|uniref:tryptophan--tRNA ligase n=1 Tax=Phytophthora kernoviae TaxID=325452 RepID=A0A3F2RVH4_9STRA|nr:hypothetical protein BBP00_00003086 [Phytophthora kernoviae]RLN71333.1 hypothetical protein BBJ29_004261 [Phytophthora kernoviae]
MSTQLWWSPATRSLTANRSLCRTFPIWRRSASSSTSNDTEDLLRERRVLSGIQPTGTPHLGNYCGAIAKWVALQEEQSESYSDDASISVATSVTTRLYSVVDLHALTVPFDAKGMPNQVHSMVAALLGTGLDPSRNILFRQSDVAAHAELAWLLSCITPLGWLQRMTQFKQKAAAAKSESSLGLLAYPVLMAADILLYRATHVPVGEDQQQHLELTRMIATTFNDRFGSNRPESREVLPKPFPMVEDEIATRTGASRKTLSRIMSLRDPTKKMSKSDKSVLSRIELTDTADDIRKKVRKATTDAVSGIYYDREERPGVSNLLDIACAVTGQSVAQLEAQYADYGTGAFKDSVADAVIATICPIGERIKQYEADQTYIDKVLVAGADQASELAAVTMKDVKEVMGLARHCPLGNAWADQVTGTDKGHNLAPCSNRGDCELDTGVCTCGTGFTGAACERRICPVGDDPLTGTPIDPLGIQRNEKQRVNCKATSGSFTLTFAGFTTEPIYADDTAKIVKAKFTALPSVTAATITFGGITLLACTTIGNDISIEFTQDFGDLPNIDGNAAGLVHSTPSVTPTLTFTTATQGTKESLPCSRRGMCDINSGVCTCYPNYFSSDGNVVCPNDCSGHGTCYTMEQLAKLATLNGEIMGWTYGAVPNKKETWDYDMIQGCKCSAGWEGHDCSLRSCPTGDDPMTLRQQNEVQILVCKGSSGFFTLKFRDAATPQLPFNAPVTSLATALEALTTIGKVLVSYSTDANGVTGTPACNAAGSNNIRIEFLTNFGDLPPLRWILDGALILTLSTDGVGGSVQGTKEEIVCSNRGICNHLTGVCRCAYGFTSSDGFGGEGDRGDCGYMEPIYLTSAARQANQV